HELAYVVVLKPTGDVSAGTGNTDGTGKEKSGQPTPKTKDHDDKEKPTIKGNADATLVLYARKEPPNYAQAIIVSGDGDFFSLAEYLEEQKKLANILTPNWQY